MVAACPLASPDPVYQRAGLCARILTATVVNGRLSSANDGAFVICDGLMMISVASRMCLLSARSPFAVFFL